MLIIISYGKAGALLFLFGSTHFGYLLSIVGSGDFGSFSLGTGSPPGNDLDTKNHRILPSELWIWASGLFAIVALVSTISFLLFCHHRRHKTSNISKPRDLE